MGKRKSSSKPQAKKKRDPLPTTFTCLFCNHEKSVDVKLDKKLGIGQLECKVCGQRFQCGINYLSAAVDVYGEWVDAADAVAQGANTDSRGAGASSSRPKPAASKYVDDEGDDRNRYSGDGIVADDDEYD